MKKKLIIGLSTCFVIIAVAAVIFVFVVLKPFESNHTHEYVGLETTAATCTEAGEITYTCSCGDSYTEAIPATGHTAVSANNGVAATCTTAGRESDTVCSVCHETLTTGNEIPVLDHGYDDGVIVKAATCTAEGEITYTCTVCGETKTETIPTKEHTEVVDAAVAPTCTETGLAEGKHCSVCGETLVAQKVVPATGHSYESEITKAATCTETGLITYTCSCGDSYTEETPKAEHSWDDGEVIAVATCTEAGIKRYTCANCDATKTEIVFALGHNYTLTEKSDATCTQDGYLLYTCTSCNVTKKEVIPATGHRYESEVTKGATCLETGLITYTCSCGDSYTEETPKAEHSWNDGVVTTAATCTATGVKTFTCTVCGETKTEIVSAMGHNYTLTEKKDATCTQDGYLLYTCTSCNGTKKDVIPATGHYFGDDNVCDNCGYEATDHEHTYVKTVVAPGCTTMGYTEYVCSCGASYRTDYIDQKGHSWNAGETTLAKTCSSDGVKTYTCTVCKATKTEIVKAGHEWSETVMTAATCTTNGKISKVCTVCGAEETEVIAASHSWNSGTVTNAATCTAAGQKVCTCTVCGATQTFEIPALGHNYYNGICTRCGESYLDNITDDSSHLLYGMYFVIDDVISNYGSETINEYGVMLYVNEGAKLEKVAVYLTQEGALWRRCIACTGTDIEFAIYVPYLSYGEEILYTGLNSDMINTFALSQGADGIWRYNDYTTIGANLENDNGDLLLSLYDIAQSGAKTRIFGNLSDMITWLKGGAEEHTHSYISEVTKTATCTETGLITYTCSCGDSYTEETPKGEHRWNDGVETQAATCTEAGLITYTCTVCGETKTETVAALGHDYINGVCTRCNGIDSDHAHTYGDGVVTQAATCTEAGLITYTCTVCSETKTETVAALGHNYVNGVCTRCNGIDPDNGESTDPVHTHSYTSSVTKAATCTEAGVKTLTCSCGDSYTATIPALGHSYTSTVTRAATCTQAGVITYTCARCNYSYTVNIYAEHSYTLAETKAATCTVSGYQLYRCSVCGDEYKVEIPAGGGHNYVGTVTKAATTEEEGVMTYVCSVCGNSYTVAIAKLHSGEGYILLIQDNLPWTTDNNTVILNYLTNAGYISGWDIATSTQAASLDFSQYDIIYIANDQTTSTYNQLKTLNERLAAFAESGGVLIYGACDNGWAGGNISYTLPGGVTKSNYYSNYNYIVDDGHDIITGALTGGCKITNAILYGTYSSHTTFYGMPQGYNVILQDAQGNPTLVEYPLGEGYVIASGLTWEYTYERTFVDGTSFAKEIYDDLFVYAMTLVNVCEHEYGAGETVAPTCEEQGYTKHVCAICGRESRTNYVPALGHTYGNGVTTKEATCTAEGEITYTCTVCGETKTETVAALGHNYVNGVCTRCNGIDPDHTHTYGDGVITKAATCAEAGVKTFTCTVCGYSYTETIPALSHSWNVGEITTAATCTATGVKTFTCTVCGATDTETVDALGHNYVNGVCTRCGAQESSADQLYTRVDENGNESSTGKYILFGSYPQSQVTDSATLANLNAQTTALPTSTNANGWTDYGYYISGSVTSYMWYKDVTYGGNKYRAVYFTSYRPYWTDYSSSTGNTYQDDNGYYISTVYWFKYEPIKWRILEESNGTAFLMADIILDSQQYYHTTSSSTRTAVENYNDAYYAGNGSTVTASAYANNYLYSDVRAWLNETFYATAFTEYEKQLVQTTLVDNSAATTSSSSNSYACANTNDKVFLLSYKDVINSSYGFASSSTYDTARQLKSTAYAKSQGCFASTSSSYLGNGWWWLRSPDYSYSGSARSVKYDGDVLNYRSVLSTNVGVVPALNIRL